MINLLGSFVLLDWLWLIILGVILIVLIILFFVIVPVKLWFKALISGAHIHIFKLVGMKYRKTNFSLIVQTYISAKKAGLFVDIDELETHHMAGGNISNVVNALISAYSAKIELSVDTAKAIDMAGRDAFEAVKVSVNPKVIETQPICVIAQDGIELKVRVRITIRAIIGRLVGGAGEETIIARISEGVVSTIGGADDHKEILQNPDLVSKRVFAKGLDKDSAYEILSIDIADIDVGRNVGDILRVEQAEAEKKIANAKAEERRSMAVAQEQEMRAKTQEMNALKVAAEAELPKAVAKAFEAGHITVMEYYKMQNLLADTSMRNSFARDSKASN